jgi:crotonobetainyl-CoA:carnitine CoA-transferase CaiB-like acyl-CoA transferase
MPLIQPLSGIRVLDFSTLLPGPLASLILTEAGAEVIKIERPSRGDEMRSYAPKFGEDSVNFALLNRGKRSITIDLKDPKALTSLKPLIQTTDVLLEQFRPGVMGRLGLGYEAIKEINPKIIYCSLTGYGQKGPKANVAGHDLNYIAETGLLALEAVNNGVPAIPPALIADIAGGSYPIVINILLALLQRNRTGEGCYLDIAMTDNLFTLMYWALGNGFAANRWPRSGKELLTGGSPRYQIYRTKDDQFLAAAPLEDKFWNNFCNLIELSSEFRDDSKSPEKTIAEVAKIVRSRKADEWEKIFSGKDVCCNIVTTLQKAVESEQFRARGLFDRQLFNKMGDSIPALPTLVVSEFLKKEQRESYPTLSADN